ncbi:MAG: helicase associated domain-containing protein, partial [Mailhella sp.]
NVPEAYRTPGGLRLGSWIARMRSARNGRNRSFLDDGLIQRLDALGMVWLNRIDQAWENGCRHLAEYKQSHGHVNVPAHFVCADGFALGAWLARHFSSSGRATKLTPYRQEKLKALGVAIELTKPNPWECRFALVQAYYAEHGNIAIPADITAQGVNLAKWLSDQRVIYFGGRKGKSLTPEQMARLEALGMEWEASPWEKMFRRFASGENCPVWLNRQRKLYREGKLSPQQIEKLEALNIDWLMPQERAWENAYAEAHRYYAAHGNLEIPVRYITESGFKLGSWLANMRHAKSSMKRERVERLNSLGMRW